MALKTDIDKIFDEKSFYHYHNVIKGDERFRPGALVRVVAGWTAAIGSVGMYIGLFERVWDRDCYCFKILINEKIVAFSGYEIELL